MNTKSQKDKDPSIDELIAGVMSQMLTYDAFSEEYAKMNEQLQMLHKMKTAQSWSRPSGDAILGAFASLAGIVAIVANEHTHVITSKALGFVTKAKV